MSSREYEAEANRLRAQIRATIDALSRRLTPSHMASEAAARVGIADMSWSGAFDFTARRHPVPTAIIGLGIGLWTLSALRKKSGRENVAAFTTPMRELADSIVGSATKVFRERAEAKRRQFVDIAQAQVATGASTLSDKIEKELETVIDRLPGGGSLRPLIESSIQVALATALEALLAKPSRA
jgi:hypothetical protein